MSSHSKLEPGGIVVYATRPTKLNTMLFLEAGEHDTEAVWHIEMCCKSDERVPLESKAQIAIDISSAEGALVTVRNVGWASFTCWTDY